MSSFLSPLSYLFLLSLKANANKINIKIDESVNVNKKN